MLLTFIITVAKIGLWTEWLLVFCPVLCGSLFVFCLFLLVITFSVILMIYFCVIFKHFTNLQSYGVKRHFQQYFSYIVEVSFIDGGNRSTRTAGENHRPAASHWQTLSHNVVPCTSHLSWIRTHNFFGDRSILHR